MSRLRRLAAAALAAGAILASGARAGHAAPGQDTPGQDTPGQAATGQSATGQSATGQPATGQAGEPLVVCLEERVPPLSMRRGGEALGFDVAVARRVAALLGRPLAVQWFETKADPDSYPDREANALLSDGRCQLVGGFPLFARSMGKPLSATGRLPDFDGARPGDRRRWVGLGTLVPSRAYRLSAIGVVYGPKLATAGTATPGQATPTPAAPGLATPTPATLSLATTELRHLAALQGVRLGVEQRTLADAILTAYRDGMLIEQVTHVTPGNALFERLERGDYDAVLVELPRFDAWRARQPGTPLRVAGYRHPIGFNAGFVGLATAAPLLAEVDAAIGRLRQDGELAVMAREAGVTYFEPKVPDVSPPLAPAALRDD